MSQQNTELQASLDKYRGYLERDPGNIDLVAQVADLHYQMGQFDDARNLLQHSLSNGANEPGLLYRLSNIALATGNTQDAIEILKGLQASGVDNAAVQFNLAYAYMYQQQYDNARVILENIINSGDTSAPGAPVLLGRCYHHLGEMDEAMDLGQRYLENHPRDAEALGVFSLVANDCEDKKTAQNWAEAAIQLNDTNLEARVALGSLKLSSNDFEGAAAHFQSALSKHPESGRAWSGMGLVDMTNHDIDAAIESLQKAVQYMPNHIGTWHALAWCQIMKKDIDAAKASFDRSLEIDRNFNETHGGLAVIAYLQGDKVTAKSESRKAVLLDKLSFSGRFAESLLTQDTDPVAAQQMVNDILQSEVEGVPLYETVSKNMQKFSNKKRKH